MSGQSGKLKARFFAAISVAIVTTIIIATLQHFKIFEKQELAFWTPRAKAVADPAKANPNIKLVVVDQKSLDVFAKEYQFQWPVSRQFYVPIVEMLNKGGAKAIAFDLIFSESSQFLSSDDEAFASAIKKSKTPVIITTVPYRSGPELNTDKIVSLSEKIKPAPDQISPNKIQKYPGTMLPIETLLRVATGVASVREDPDSDGVYRRYTLGVSVADNFIPSIALSLATHSGKQNFNSLRELDNEGRKVLNFRGPQGTYKTYSFIDLVQSWAAIEEGKESLINPNEFKDAYVIVGVWAAGLQDLRPTPLDPVYRGVEVHATALDNILSDDFITEISLTSSIAFTGIFILAITTSIVVLDALFVSALLVIIIFSLFIVLGFASAFYGLWLPMFVPLLGMIGSVVVSFGYQYSREGKERKFIKSAFKHYVSSSVIDKILLDPTRLKLGGEKRELTLFFSDIAGFTSLSEKLDPQELSTLLNLYLTEIASVIMKHGGTVDKYVGDAVIAFWNAPIDDPYHADNAVAAAIECQERLKILSEKWKQEYGTTLQTRIGIHTGVVSVGNFGSEDRFNYTVIGDSANLASRLEGANKKLGTTILVSEATYAKLTRQFPMRRIGSVRVVGRVSPIQVYQPMSDLADNSVLLAKFEEAVLTFEKGDRIRALKLFQEVGDDPVTKAYCARIESESRLSEVSATWELSEK